MITIKGNDYKFKFTLRAMMIFEQVLNKPFAITNITDEYIYLYCMLMANNPDCNLTFDDLMDAMDEDPSIMINFKKELETYNKKASLFSTKEEGAEVKKNL